MKLTLLCFLLFTSISTTLCAQSANLDREYFKVSYVNLPSHPILEDAKRTYSSNTRSIRLSGFTKVATNGTIDFVFNFHGTKAGEVNIEKETVEEKDEDGKVISTKYYYNVHTSFSSSATLSLANSYTEKSSSNTYQESDNYVSSSFKSYSAASKYYNDNRYNIRDEYRVKHRSEIEDQIYSRVNYLYGYVPYTSSNGNNFWILGNKKHSEFGKHQEAGNGLKEIFEKMEYNQPVETLLAEVKPIVGYFDDVVVRFNGDDKKSRKVRYASFYNNALLYLKLDQPEKAKEYANKLIANDYDKGDGKRIIANADKLIEELKLNELDTRHFEVITEDISDEPVVTEIIVQAPEDTSEKSIAFLITAQNDTLQTLVTANELSRVSAVANLVDSADNEVKVFEAVNTKKMVVASGDVFEVINFQSSLAGDENASLKFAKVLVEGVKVNLYEHMTNEYVLLLNGSEEGTSTMGKNFVFGFNKELAVFGDGCAALIANVESGEFKNTKEDLTKFAKALNSCE
ncbi:hypothetical protein I2486_02610 [Cellulophaga sp. E16_2]|uniref:hypothetical protein n=1 Tax=Cellulophaga sp. E16_2 TaxID=2789297 RepID=UPI001A9293D4|nr:hypothetical protein [Cellulophaga sp. E16_2]MBO0590288.1 hypothetical protein [Cellulophaga sp. E16_2]